MHEVVRKHCMDYLVSHADVTLTCEQTVTSSAGSLSVKPFFLNSLQMKNADYFSNYVTEDFTTYINRKRKNNCHGNHIEMQAMAEMYNRPVEVYQYTTGESAPANHMPSCWSAAQSELTPPNPPGPLLPQSQLTHSTASTRTTTSQSE